VRRTNDHPAALADVFIEPGCRKMRTIPSYIYSVSDSGVQRMPGGTYLDAKYLDAMSATYFGAMSANSCPSPEWHGVQLGSSALRCPPALPCFSYFPLCPLAPCDAARFRSPVPSCERRRLAPARMREVPRHRGAAEATSRTLLRYGAKAAGCMAMETAWGAGSVPTGSLPGLREESPALPRPRSRRRT
jgi:hypothetical protein